MKQIFPILALVTTASLPLDSAIGDDSAGIQRRVFRSVTSDQEQAIAVSLDTETVEQLAVAEPPIPDVNEGEIVEDAPVTPTVHMMYSPGESIQSDEATEAEQAVGVAVTHFRRKHWEAAGEWYLKALDIEPDNQAAAEGLALSAFNAGHYSYAYELTTGKLRANPSARLKLVDAANEEIGLLIRASRFDEAEEFIAHFPEQERGLTLSREKLQLLKRLNITQTGIEPARGGSPGRIDPKEKVPSQGTSKGPTTTSFDYIDISEVSDD